VCGCLFQLGDHGCHFDLYTKEIKQTNKCNEILLLNSGGNQLLQLESYGIGGGNIEQVSEAGSYL